MSFNIFEFSFTFAFRGGNINFQKAAMDIEAGYKIWSYRVDAVHKDATQAVKDLIETNAALSQNEDEEEDGADNEEGAKVMVSIQYAQYYFEI